MISKHKDLLFVVFSSVLILSAYMFFDAIFAHKIPDFAFNIAVSVLCAFITIAVMLVTMHFQAKSDKENEFSSRIFERKLAIYREFLEQIFKMDDDNLIEMTEVQDIENKVGELALVAGQGLVETCATFVVQLKGYGVMYPRSMTRIQREHYEKTFGDMSNFTTLDDLVQAIRSDLSIVDGNVSKTLERFVSMPYDPYKMIKDPNYVDG